MYDASDKHNLVSLWKMEEQYDIFVKKMKSTIIANFYYLARCFTRHISRVMRKVLFSAVHTKLNGFQLNQRKPNVLLRMTSRLLLLFLILVYYFPLLFFSLLLFDSHYCIFQVLVEIEHSNKNIPFKEISPGRYVCTWQPIILIILTYYYFNYFSSTRLVMHVGYVQY